ncbi:MAG TPA: NADPH:quinone reductase [Rubrivivax sp.]|nr:NADPH:quinone reductase [Rubrivivax sp.]
MLAACYERTGAAAEVLRVVDLPDPVPGPGEVGVRLRWSGINPTDVKSRSGARGPQMPFARVVPHSDGMGVIDAVGPGVTESRLGERVWLWNAAWGRACGTAAQRIALPAEQAVPLPEAASDEAGACLGIPAMTALHALLTDGGVAGKRVLVAGGGGAVGHYAVQFARLLGARQVLATASTPAKQRLAAEAGAAAVVDYRDADAAQRLRDATGGEGVDRIVEVDLAANAALDLAVMRPGALWVAYGNGGRQFTLPFFPMISAHVLLRLFIVFRLDAAERARAHALLAGWLGQGALRHHVASNFDLASVAQAHDAVESGRAGARVLLRLP